MNTNWEYAIRIFVGALVVYRISTDMALEEGPFRLFERMRNLYLKDDWLGRGIRCPICVSWWIAYAVTFGMFYERDLFTVLISWMAIAGLVKFMIKSTQKVF